jgi:hypothetical protein
MSEMTVKLQLFLIIAKSEKVNIAEDTILRKSFYDEQ